MKTLEIIDGGTETEEIEENSPRLPLTDRDKAEAFLRQWQFFGGHFGVKNGRLLMAPADMATRYADTIRALKPHLLALLDHCPTCGASLKLNWIPGRDGQIREMICLGHYQKIIGQMKRGDDYED